MAPLSRCALSSAVLLLLGAAEGLTDYAKYVNPFIGASGPYAGQAFGGGDIFVGGAVPFGVAKVGLDTYEPNVSYSTLNGGYTPKGKVTAISMMHEHGTGGSAKYGVVPQMPLTDVSPPVNLLNNRTYWQERVGKDKASVGYFKTKLENGVLVELSAARHSGIMQYGFPKGEKHVLVDVSHYLPAEAGSYSSQVFLGGKMRTHHDGSYTGYGTWGGGWNEGAPFRVFFCGVFDQKPDQAKVFRGRNTDPMIRYHTLSNGPPPHPQYVGNETESSMLNDRIGALFTWSDSSAGTIKSKVGISFISAEKACMFQKSEIQSWNLQDTVDSAVKEWNKDVFSKIRVDTGPKANKTNLALLYSSLYFMHLMPSDRTGENPLWDSEEPSWDDFYTAWDIFRCTVSLYHLIQPSYYESMIRSLIDIWRYEGFMPDGRSGNFNGLVQGGSNADNILADAYVKGLRGKINWQEGYMAMKKDAEVLPFNTFSPDDPLASMKEGRGALNDWIPLGYVSSDRNYRCISRTVEYSLNDFAVSQVAAGIKSSEQQKYLKRSAGWQKIWDPDVKSEGFQGFLAPKKSNGHFNHSGYSPLFCGECESLSITYEATPWEYSFVLPHDMKSLIKLMGGADEFEKRLDYIFLPNTAKQNLGANGAGITTLMNIGNEPDFATPYLYNYIGKQWKSVNQSRHLGTKYFKDEEYGVPGNSDAGALNSWLIWQMLGLYPIVTQPVYLLQSPWFPDISMSVGEGKTLNIKAHNLKMNPGKGSDDGGFYVQKVMINGKNWEKNWFEHDDVMTKGGTIEFFLGKEPKVWEKGSVPPSPGHIAMGME